MEEQKQVNTILHCAQSKTLRDIVSYINTHNINREDILTIQSADDGYFLLYYQVQ